MMVTRVSNHDGRHPKNLREKSSSSTLCPKALDLLTMVLNLWHLRHTFSFLHGKLCILVLEDIELGPLYRSSAFISFFQSLPYNTSTLKIFDALKYFVIKSLIYHVNTLISLSYKKLFFFICWILWIKHNKFLLKHNPYPLILGLNMSWHLSFLIIKTNAINVWSPATTRRNLANWWLNLKQIGDLALITLESIFGWLEGAWIA